MIGEEHEGAADEILRVFVPVRPGAGDLFVQRLGRRLGVDHRGDREAQDAGAGGGAALAHAVIGARIGFGGLGEDGDGAVDRRGAARRRQDRAHRGRNDRQVRLGEGIGGLGSHSSVAHCSKVADSASVTARTPR
ncbi:MAG: hypothetical protein WDN08_01425 [Rhizomicrobium sp.]